MEYLIPLDTPSPHDLSTGRGRLLFLADWLEKHIVPKPKKWMFRVWGKLFDAKKMGLETENCSSVGCAVGWASTIPEFKRLGLGMVTEGVLLDEPGLLLPVFGYLRNFDAVAEFFGVDKAMTSYLFNPDHYGESYLTSMATPVTEVIERIRRVANDPDRSWHKVEDLGPFVDPEELD